MMWNNLGVTFCRYRFSKLMIHQLRLYWMVPVHILLSISCCRPALYRESSYEPASALVETFPSTDRPFPIPKFLISFTMILVAALLL